MLLVLAPLSGEYLIGYDTSTGRPLALLGGLLILAPLYGAPAVLIRELARRNGIRWPGIAALALAAGVLQAGVIDQSLFARSYRDIDYWPALVEPTWMPWAGLGAFPALGFLAGHAIWSFGAPIALTEAVRPDRATRPWLGRRGLIAMALLYAAAAALVLSEHLRTEDEHASPVQLAGCLVAVVALVAFAITRGRRPAEVVDRRVPRPMVLAGAAVCVTLPLDLAPSTWTGFVGAGAVLAAGVAAASAAARSSRWRVRHVVALATGALLARAAVGFLVPPLGDVPAAARYAHHAFFLAGSALLGWWAARRAEPVTAGQRRSQA